MTPDELRAKVKEMGECDCDCQCQADEKAALAAMLDAAIRKLAGIPGYEECDDIARAGGLEGGGDE